MTFQARWLAATLFTPMLSIALVAPPVSAGGVFGSPAGTARKSPPQDVGCFGSSSARGGKAKAAAVVGSAIGAAIGGPLLARALPTPGRDASLFTRLALNTLAAAAWSEYIHLLQTFGGESASPLFVQVGPGQFAAWSASGLQSLAPPLLGPLGSGSLGDTASLLDAGSPALQPETKAR